MTFEFGDATVFGVEAKEFDLEIPSKTAVASSALAAPQQFAGDEGPSTSVAANTEQPGATTPVRAGRWEALDRLLQVSFGMISPAYLFNSYR